MDITIRPATGHDLEEVRQWIAMDTAPGEYIGAYSSGQGLINIDDPANGWVAMLQEEVVGYVSLVENPPHHATIGFIVKPSHRREGIAKTFVPALLEKHEMDRFVKIIGTPHLGDTASEKVLRHAGFYQTGFDADGSIVYERR